MGNELIKIEYLGIIFSTGYWEVCFLLKEVFFLSSALLFYFRERFLPSLEKTSSARLFWRIA